MTRRSRLFPRADVIDNTGRRVDSLAVATARPAISVAAGFPHLATGVARVKSGTGDAKILICGDSTVAGVGSSTAATVPNLRSWPTDLSLILNAAGYPSATGLVVPPHTVDTRFTPDANWSINPLYGFSDYLSYKGVALNAKLTFADTSQAFDTYDVYYLQFGSSANFSVQATGGTLVNVTAAINTSTVKKVTVTAGSASTSNVLTITNTTSGNSFIVGVESSRSTVRTIRIGNNGASGSRTLNWLTEQSFGVAASWAAYGADLTLICLGINDAANSVTAAQWVANMQTLVSYAPGDVAVVSFVPSNDVTRYPLEQQYIAAISQIGVPVFDMWGHVGGAYSTLSNLGAMSDTLHPNDVGYWIHAQYIASLLFNLF